MPRSTSRYRVSTPATMQVVLLVGRVGALRDGVSGLLGTLPRIGRIVEANDATAAHHALAADHLDLVVVDATLPDNELADVVATVTTRAASVPCLVLVETADQASVATAAGASQVVLTGMAARGLSALIEQLLR